MSSAEVVLRGFRKLYGRNPEVIASAPGRLDLLNTHQDYKGLPVVGVAINLRCYVAVSEARATPKSRVGSLNLRGEGHAWLDEFDAAKPTLRGGGWFGDYVRAAVRALLNAGYSVPQFNALIHSEVPIASGLSSSAALLVSFIKALTTLAGANPSPREVAELAYIAEHDVLGVPCGRLDQYTSAYGGVVLVKTKPPYGAERLPFNEGVYVASVTPVKHSTASIHPARQAEIEEGLKALLKQPLPEDLRRRLGLKYWEPDWASLSEEELTPYLSRIPETPRKRILYTVRAHASTTLALRAMRGEEVGLEDALDTFGERALRHAIKAVGVADDLRSAPSKLPPFITVAATMNYQHALLRDLYEVSAPEIEAVIKASLEAGAAGSKISGAGFGGAIVSLTTNEGTASKVTKACIELGKETCLKPMKLKISDGVKTHSIKR